MKILLTILICTSVPCFGERSLPTLILQAVLAQPDEQSEQEQKPRVSYSEAAYYVAEGAVVTALTCLPTILIYKGLGFEKKFDADFAYVKDEHLPYAVAALQVAPGAPWALKYGIEICNCDQYQLGKKRYDPQSGKVILEPVSNQDALNAKAKTAGSIMALLGIGVAIVRSLRES